MNVILTREFIIHLLEAYRICHGIITIFTTLLIITYTDRKFSSFFTFKMCFTTKISTPRSGVLISLEKMKLIQLQIRTEKKKRKQNRKTALCDMQLHGVNKGDLGYLKQHSTASFTHPQIMSQIPRNSKHGLRAMNFTKLK